MPGGRQNTVMGGSVHPNVIFVQSVERRNKPQPFYLPAEKGEWSRKKMDLLNAMTGGSDGKKQSSSKVGEKAYNQSKESEEVTVTDEIEYTEHTAIIHLKDGTQKEVVFDSMNKGSHGITFKNYTGVSMSSLGKSFQSEAFLFVTYSNLSQLETIDREKKTMEYEYKKTVKE